MTEKIKEFRIRMPGARETKGEIPHFRYFNAFTAEEALNSELAVRQKEGNDSPIDSLEEYNPYSDKWTEIYLENNQDDRG